MFLLLNCTSIAFLLYLLFVYDTQYDNITYNFISSIDITVCPAGYFQSRGKCFHLPHSVMTRWDVNDFNWDQVRVERFLFVKIIIIFFGKTNTYTSV